MVTHASTSPGATAFDSRRGSEPSERLPEWLRQVYPFHLQSAVVNAHRMNYVDEGQGRPVLMLHGNPTWSIYFRHLIAGLRDRFRIIAPDHIGCGLSDKPQDYPYTLARRIDDIESLIDSLGIKQLDLVVHDWGGAIGFGWATRRPQNVRRIVVLNTAAFPGGPIPWRIRICRGPVLGRFLVQRLNAFARAALFMATADRARLTRLVRAAYLYPYRTYDDRRALYEFVRDIPVTRDVPSHSVLRAIEAALPKLADVPMLIGWGMKDFCFHEYFLKEWVRRFPRALVHQFDNAGHYVAEDAHEQLVPLMADFLEHRFV